MSVLISGHQHTVTLSASNSDMGQSISIFATKHMSKLIYKIAHKNGSNNIATVDQKISLYSVSHKKVAVHCVVITLVETLEEF